MEKIRGIGCTLYGGCGKYNEVVIDKTRNEYVCTNCGAAWDKPSYDERAKILRICYCGVPVVKNPLKATLLKSCHGEHFHSVAKNAIELLEVA